MCIHVHPHGAQNFSGFVVICLRSIGQSTPHDSDVVPVMKVATIAEALCQQLGSAHDYALHCPRGRSHAA
jgi:hypothetical protein